jgi:hypothetical protein
MLVNYTKFPGEWVGTDVVLSNPLECFLSTTLGKIITIIAQRVERSNWKILLCKVLTLHLQWYKII